MVSFTCNICGTFNTVEHFASEPASCACGSNVRLRSLIYLLSMELFGTNLTLSSFPRIKAIRGLGMSDQQGYARILADKFDYTNTYFDQEPRFDFTQPHPELAGQYDFILSADVLEHIAPPVERALEESCNLLKPHGFMGVTVFCNPGDNLRELFPELHEYRIVPLAGSPVLINRRVNGALEIRDDLVFHGGLGATLEMREFGITELRNKLIVSGFSELHFLTDNVPEIGILFDQDVSQPLIARKAPFVMEAAARNQMLTELKTAATKERERADRLQRQIALASDSRWLRLGRRLGIGPDFEVKK